MRVRPLSNRIAPRRSILFESSQFEKSSENADPGIELLRRWQDAGDPEALDELLGLEIDVLKRRLRGQGWRNTRDPMSMSDIAQATVVRFLEVHEAPHFENPRQLRAYLWTAAWRLLVQRLQRRERGGQRIEEMDSGDPEHGLSTTGGFGALEASDRSVALELALNLLKPADREILRLVYFEHLGIGGAAERIGVGHDAAKMRLVRARRELAKKLCRWEERIEAP